MKVILSRKGFDGATGGYASPIFDDGTMQSLPIPSVGGNRCFSELQSVYKDYSIYDLMHGISPYYKNAKCKRKLTIRSACHLDPDIYKSAVKRDRGWRAGFGQAGTSEKVLQRCEIGHDDMFLFFGWFKEYSEDESGRFIPIPHSDKHVIFGYMQVDFAVRSLDDLPNYMKQHPHAKGVCSDNTIYVARKRCSWDPSIPGYGTFNFDKSLVLTKNGEKRSRWKLPAFFKGLDIEYHNQDSWKNGYFQSTARGQEFVIEENTKVTKWAQGLINKNYK